MPQYTIKFKFMMARAGRGAGAVSGSNGEGEIDITVDAPFDPVASKTDENLINGCKDYLLQTNKKIQKAGKFVLFEITGICKK